MQLRFGLRAETENGRPEVPLMMASPTKLLVFALLALLAGGAGAAVLGVSVDAQPAKAAWAKTLGPISYDLLSDFHPHGEVAQKYGVFRAADGISALPGSVAKIV